MIGIVKHRPLRRVGNAACPSFARRNSPQETIDASDRGLYDDWKYQEKPAYSFGVDTFTQQRLLYLRDEIASLRHDNELYRLRGHSTQLQTMANESRRSRLKEIKEELLTMGLPPRNKP